MHRWILNCGQLFRTYKETWSYLIPSSSQTNPVLAEHFFNCACSLMARQLRETIEISLKNFLAFLSKYKEGNSYNEEFHDLLFPLTPVSDM